MPKSPAQQAAIAIAMKKAGKKPKSMEKGGRTKKIKPIKMSGNVDFGNKDYVDFDMPRDQARKAFARVLNKNAGRDALDLKGFNDTRNFEIGNLPGGGTRFFLSSPAPSAKKGMKFKSMEKGGLYAKSLRKRADRKTKRGLQLKRETPGIDFVMGRATKKDKRRRDRGERKLKRAEELRSKASRIEEKNIPKIEPQGKISFAKKGMKFNPKYTRGSSNVGKRKKLMSEISNIYKQHRGTKAKRQKKGFPPAVAARLKQLMKQRDKI